MSGKHEGVPQRAIDLAAESTAIVALNEIRRASETYKDACQRATQVMQTTIEFARLEYIRQVESIAQSVDWTDQSGDDAEDDDF